MKNIYSLWLAISFCLFGFHTGFSAEPEKKPDLVVAMVNGIEIKLSQLDSVLLLRPKSNAPITASVLKDLRKAAIEDCVDDLLLKQFLEKEKCWPSENEIEKQVAVLKESLAKKKSSYPEYLKENGLTESSIKEQFAVMIGCELFALKIGTDDELKKFHDLHVDYFKGVKVRFTLVYFPFTANATMAKKNAIKSKAIQIRNKIDSIDKENNFAMFAKQFPYQQGIEDLGWVSRFDSLFEDELTDSAYKLKVNEVSSIIELPQAIAILKLLERSKPSETAKPFPENIDWVRDVYAHSLRKVVLNKMRQSATISINLP